MIKETENNTEEKVKIKRKKKKRRKKRYLLKFFLIVLMLIGLYYFLSSSIFDINKFEIENNHYYTSQEIIEKSKAKTGENIFAFSISDIRKQLLKDPYIKSVKIKRKLPTTITIDVLERKEFAVVPNGEEFIIIDKEGVVLKTVSENSGLTVLTGLTLTEHKPGKPLAVGEGALFADTLGLLVAADSKDMFFRKIDISSVVVKAHIYEYLLCEGTPENIKNNLDSLQEVLYELYSKGIERGVLKIGNGDAIPYSPLIE